VASNATFFVQPLLNCSEEISNLFSTLRNPKLKCLEFGWRRIDNRVKFLDEYHVRSCRSDFNNYCQLKSASNFSDYKESVLQQAEATLEISELISKFQRRIRSILTGGRGVQDDGKPLWLGALVPWHRYTQGEGIKKHLPQVNN
jgi:hypothetical protein